MPGTALARGRLAPETDGLVTNPATLLLVPTQLELQRLEDRGGFDPARARVELCGFGPVAAAARTAQLVARHRPERVLLVGIAGAYSVDTHPVGEAFEFSRVAITGIGAGEGEDFVGPPALGFPQWPGSECTTVHPILDEIRLASPEGGLLLSTCAASSSAEHAARRLSAHPDAIAEDMEGFAVAMACALFATPLRIVRGISNRVGDRDPAHWRIPGALEAARRRALELLGGDGSEVAP